MTIRVMSCVLLLSAGLAAQQVGLPEAWTGARVDGHAGRSAANLGDVDGDGVDDIAWGEPWYTDDHVSHGRVVVRSGADGATLAVLDGAAGGDQFGWDVAGGGDFDGDGVPDLAVGIPRHEGVFEEGGLVTIYSGATFLPLADLLPNAAFDIVGMSVAFVADLDGDGDDEVLAGAPHLGSGVTGLARLYAGGTGDVLADFSSGTPSDLFGAAVADVGDVNDDGFTDLGVGAPGASFLGGSVWIFSGRAVIQGQGAAVLHTLTQPTLFDRFGASLDGAGDVNGDGHDDFVVGNPGSPGLQGQVTIHSGSTGVELRRFDGTSFSQLGGQVARVGDLDGDGVPDVAATGFGSQALGARGVARAWSAATGTLLMDVPADAQTLNAYGAVTAGGDRDGDGRLEVVFGMLENDDAEGDVPGRGKLLRVERGEILVHRGLGLLGEQGLPMLSADGTLEADSPIALRVLGGLPLAPLFFVVGVSEWIAPLEGGYLVPAPDIVLGLALDADGALPLGGTWPAGVPGGVTVSFQGWIVDASGPFGFTATNGITALTP